jgi:DNA polymerase-1
MLSHISFGEGPKSLAILIPTKDFQEDKIREHYVEPLVAKGIKEEEIIAFNLDHNKRGKTPVTLIVKPWLEQLERILDHFGIKHVLIAEPQYFKTICKERKADPHYGYQKATIWPNISGYITSNYKALMFNDAVQSKINLSLDAVVQGMTGGKGVFHEQVLQNAQYPTSLSEIARTLAYLKDRPALTVDIEAYSLRVDKAGIGTIAFGLDTRTAIAFTVDVLGFRTKEKRELLRDFFRDYQGGLIFHNATYDVKVIIWNLFMEHPTDYVGMLEGLHCMFRNLHDTKILSYLALNTCSDISLSLKDLAFEHTGNYAQDGIEDITKIPVPELLEYNATDTIATWYVYDKYRQVVRDEQEYTYQEAFRPTLKVLTQMELCGTPLNMGAVLNAERKMDDIRRKHLDAIMNHPEIQDFEWTLRDREAEKANRKLKKKRKDRNDFKDFRFNPNSDVQLQILLHERWELPVLEKTDTGQPSTKNSVLRDLITRVDNSRKWKNTSISELLDHICELHEVSKILDTFIPAFKNNSIPKNAWHYLHGCFNLGGTKSGRLSSSDPNLQNIPSTGTQYAKLIKRCFEVPRRVRCGVVPAWLFVGADYASLEDRISALLTKDPHKLSVYTDGYDGHCLRAYHYFKDRMPDINAELAVDGVDRVATINAIEERYPALRQLSKGPTFALTYMGTWRTLVKNFGLTERAAKAIERNYHELYSVANAWVMSALEEASRNGYATLAYRYDILPVMQIHDAQYYMLRNSLGCLKWMNDNLIECMEWNELEPIQHPTVKLGAILELYYPTWADKISIPNRLSKAGIRDVIQTELDKRRAEKRDRLRLSLAA